MTRLLASLLALLLVIQPAAAAVVQITTKDAAGTSRSFNVTTNTDITGNLVPNQVICDQSAGTTCATVTAGNALKVDGSAVTQPASIATWAAGSLGAMANYGTSPGAVLVPGVNAFITNTATVTANAGSGTFAISAAAGQIVDGGIATIGLKADAATCATGNTQIACLRQIDADIKAAIPAGTNIIGGLFLVPSTTGGLLNSVTEPTASDNHAVIKNGAGQVYGIHVWNNSATINYGRLYNAGTGFNGCNSATNLAYEFHIPASTSDAGFVVPIPQGIAFATGISLCVTGAYGQTNTTNATASAISLNVQYN